MKRELTERERSYFGPRDSKKPGSLPWCWQTLDYVKNCWKENAFSFKLWQEALDEIKEQRVWEIVPPGNPYGSLDALLEAEIGVSEKTATEEVQDQALNAKDLGKSGDNQHTERGCDNVTSSSKRGNQASYLTSRIKRDHPEILERMKAGEFKSVRQAALAARIIKEPTTLALLNRYWKKANPAEQVQFIKNITKDLQKLAIPITFVKLNPTNTRKHEQENRSQTFYQRVDK